MENWINVAVVDDERQLGEQIKRLVLNSGKIDRVDMYESGEELLASETYYHIILLDIQMDGLNGIETARELRSQKKESLLIFITGRKEYVFAAFDVAAFHYLLKPIEERQFQDVLKRAVQEVEKHREITQQRLLVKTRSRNYSLNQKEIVFIESRAKKVEIHTTSGIIEAYASMNQLEKQLGEMFFRCHRGYLVNMAYIVQYGGDSITLCSGEEILLAKERYSEFVKGYMRYLKNGGIAYV